MNLEIITKCNSDELKAFITARNQYVVIARLPNKEDISSAIQRELNLISLVYEYYSLPNLLWKQVLDEEEENELVDDDISHKNNRQNELFTILNIDNA